MREFKGTGIFAIPGRGTVITTNIPKKDPLPSVGEHVLIDNIEYEVRGVEYHLLLTDPPQRPENVGLNVRMAK